MNVDSENLTGINVKCRIFKGSVVFFLDSRHHAVIMIFESFGINVKTRKISFDVLPKSLATFLTGFFGNICAETEKIIVFELFSMQKLCNGLNRLGICWSEPPCIRTLIYVKEIFILFLVNFWEMYIVLKDFLSTIKMFKTWCVPPNRFDGTKPMFCFEIWLEASGEFSKNRSTAFFCLQLFLWNLKLRECSGRLLGQSFVSSGCWRGPLQDEGHSGSHPHSFPGLY